MNLQHIVNTYESPTQISDIGVLCGHSRLTCHRINLKGVTRSGTCDEVDTLEACLQIETSYRQFPLYHQFLHSSLESVFGGPHAITETFLQ